VAYHQDEPPRFAVRDLDVFAELRRISVELRALSQATSAPAGSGARFNGRDTSETVTVTVDGRQHVQDIVLDPRWEQRLPRDGVGAALMQAYGEAVSRMLTSSAEAFDQAEQDTDRALLHQQARTDLDGYRPRNIAPEDLLYEVQDQLRQIEALQRYGDAPSLSLPTRRDATVAGPAGFVEITVHAGQVNDIRVLLHRLPPMTTNGAVAQEAMGAFRAAARVALARS
jgi:hypothetical protein